MSLRCKMQSSFPLCCSQCMLSLFLCNFLMLPLYSYTFRIPRFRLLYLMYSLYYGDTVISIRNNAQIFKLILVHFIQIIVCNRLSCNWCISFSTFLARILCRPHNHILLVYLYFHTPLQYVLQTALQ